MNTSCAATLDSMTKSFPLLFLAFLGAVFLIHAALARAAEAAEARRLVLERDPESEAARAIAAGSAAA